MSSGPPPSFPTRQLVDYTSYGNKNISMILQGNGGLPIENYPALEKLEAESMLRSNQSLNVLDHSQISDFTTNNFHSISEPQILGELGSNGHNDLSINLNNVSPHNLIMEQRVNIDTRYHQQRGSMGSLPELESSLSSTTQVIPHTGYLNNITGCSEQLRLRGSSEGQRPLGTRNSGLGSELFGEDHKMNKIQVLPGSNIELDVKDHKLEMTPAWTELKTKAGKERKRLPLACVACRRKKTRCSGEKPACNHCLRSRIPCIYKVTTRKATPRTDYMGILDKRIKRMEERIFKIIPREANYSIENPMVRTTIKPRMSRLLARNFAGKKRFAEEAFGQELDNWSHTSSAPRLNEESKEAKDISKQKAEELKLLSEGADELPSKEIQQHLAEVFFEKIEGQAYYLLHKPSFMKKLGSSLMHFFVQIIC